jgi:hypothetical protein
VFYDKQVSQKNKENWPESCARPPSSTPPKLFITHHSPPASGATLATPEAGDDHAPFDKLTAYLDKLKSRDPQVHSPASG